MFSRGLWRLHDILRTPVNRRSMDQHSAIYVYHRAGDVGRKIGGKKEADIGYVLSEAQAIERDSLHDFSLHRFGEPAGGNVGLDQAGRNGIDSDAIRPKF